MVRAVAAAQPAAPRQRGRDLRALERAKLVHLGGDDRGQLRDVHRIYRGAADADFAAAAADHGDLAVPTGLPGVEDEAELLARLALQRAAEHRVEFFAQRVGAADVARNGARPRAGVAGARSGAPLQVDLRPGEAEQVDASLRLAGAMDVLATLQRELLRLAGHGHRGVGPF